ncbi:Type II secretion system protein E [Rhodovastum atsumiense]|uniref:Type II/IV secretion system protein n=1 Tax=Rhodovastum atsumiense TaxID=504468 RepID=A0A5M6IMB8_9PROT|nr:GspE/PulE family protein [Rhodovastum atsumiense]KAA5609396.1 type II/IV secretion system protein [Rhodovastum atsumiense]CAH2601849.1 Type II secretion system protein E [Rhodovastum atsumiense]
MAAAVQASTASADLAALLLRRGCCDARAVERGRRVAAETGQRLDVVLQQLGLVGERDMAAAFAELLQTGVVLSSDYPAALPQEAVAIAPRFLRSARALPLAVEHGRLVVALADPLDTFTADAIAAAAGLPVRIAVAVPIELEAALDRLCPVETDTAPAEAESTPLEDDAERLKDLASEAPVIRLVNQIIARAVETQASDIHIEPFEDALRIRYRYDGVLHEAETHPPRLAAAIISRIKIMARLDIAERRLPQDGRIRLAVRGQDVDFRISTVATMHGETVVLRVLDRSAVTFDYAGLGLDEAVVARLSQALHLPNGIVLVTGPTGSGKTTTLYTGLLSLNSVVRKVVTIEDPIEYQLRGINQIQVKPQIGLTFASLLRSILRQDPDVIMVGEIRDLETAEIAVQAALTGHLVLSTLHTNSAASSITRLRDMGLEDYLITAVLRGVLAQRLLRRLCPDCRRPAEVPPELVQRFNLAATTDRPVLWHAVGCPRCRGTGYRGRLAIAEFLEPNEEIAHLVFTRADHVAIERAAVAAGMTTMFQAGLAAALAGTTTIEEVVRSIRAEA